MTSGDGTDRDLPAGPFSEWLREMRVALRGEATSKVACNGCTACCESSQFVHIAPDETDTLAHVPAALCFPAPLMPEGHVVLGYDERGRCPMLGDAGCTIYEHRPRACRTYDCRIFAATGLEPEDKPLVVGRVRRWRFDLSGERDRAEYEALRKRVETLRDDSPPGNATQLAVGAVASLEVQDDDRS
jgi:Fe-S-cluster containining protein